jgi:hypothetical protein
LLFSSARSFRYLEGIVNLLIVDAVETGQASGALLRSDALVSKAVEQLEQWGHRPWRKED